MRNQRKEDYIENHRMMENTWLRDLKSNMHALKRSEKGFLCYVTEVLVVDRLLKSALACFYATVIVSLMPHFSHLLSVARPCGTSKGIKLCETNFNSTIYVV